MKLEFKPIDFCEKPDSDPNCPHGVGNDWCSGTFLAIIANTRLAEMLKDAPVVYSECTEDAKDFRGSFGWWTLAKTDKSDTHRALLINIEEIKK